MEDFRAALLPVAAGPRIFAFSSVSDSARGSEVGSRSAELAQAGRVRGAARSRERRIEHASRSAGAGLPVTRAHQVFVPGSWLAPRRRDRPVVVAFGVCSAACPGCGSHPERPWRSTCSRPGDTRPLCDDGSLRCQVFGLAPGALSTIVARQRGSRRARSGQRLFLLERFARIVPPLRARDAQRGRRCEHRDRRRSNRVFTTPPEPLAQ